MVAVGYGLWAVKDRIQEWRAPGPVERLHNQYAAGEIDEQELERRLEIQMDDRNEEIREHVEQVGGVGPVTAREIALSFESVDALRRADRDDLEAVPNVGPKRAEQIAGRFE
jgi:ERCC4-type nuclease